MDDVKRLEGTRAIVSLSFLVGIIFSYRLWLSNRLYPLDPILHFLSLAPAWIDYFLLALLLALLALITYVKKPRTYIIVAITIILCFFAQDQGRIFPSFYEYTILLGILAFYPWHIGEDAGAAFVLNACRFAVALIYFWSGVLKINPLFENQLAQVMLPLLSVIPILRGAFVHWASIIAPFVEIEIGIGLLFKKTRRFALAEALFMHAALFFLIGPFRAGWNESAWIWNLASGFIVFVLFFRAENIQVSTSKPVQKFVFAGIFLLLGILPALNLFNLWDSALSFNIFSGNVTSAQIYITGALAEKLPPALAPYVESYGGINAGVSYPFNIEGWSLAELHAEPYPESRVFRNVAGFLCSYATASSDLQLTIRNKLALDGGSASGGLEHYDCSKL